VEIASRALTSGDQNWVQIDKELLTIEYGLDRFEQGKEILVKNDYSPLTSIF